MIATTGFGKIYLNPLINKKGGAGNDEGIRIVTKTAFPFYHLNNHIDVKNRNLH